MAEISKQKRRLRQVFAIAASATLAVILLQLTGALQRLELISYDARVRFARADARPDPRIAVVLIDEASLHYMDEKVGRWPWPRAAHADVLNYLSLGGPRAIIFDVLFAEHQKAQSEQDEALALVTEALGNVIHAAGLDVDTPDEGGTLKLGQPLPADIIMRHRLATAEGFPDAGNNNYIVPTPELASAARRIGIVTLAPDEDGIFRRARPFWNYQGHVFPALSTAGLLDLMLADAPAIISGRKHIKLGDEQLPTDAQGRMLVNMYPQRNFRPYSISGIVKSANLLAGGDVANLLIPPEEFTDKIVFIGGSAIGLNDLKATPMDRTSPGVFIHASLASNLLQKDMLRELPRETSQLAAVLLGLLTTALVVYLTSFALKLTLPPLLALGWLGASYGLFTQNLVIEAVPPFLAVFISWLGALAYLSFTEGRDKRRVRTMLGQYVSPAILAAVVDRFEDHVKAEVGVSEHMTILFSDIRGFTNLSESLPPRQVVEMLNSYFSLMTDVIFKHDGTLDKFIGDAIMAFWGAPIRITDHADKALLGAMDMVQALDVINSALCQRNLPPLRTGIGLHTGDVILGNIGSEKKLDYTVIGDNVNLASRVEGLTGKYACSIILTEATYAELTVDVPCALVDAVRVKGKKKPIRIYRPIARVDDPEEKKAEARRQVELTDAAFAAYQARNWGKAIALYQQLPEEPTREILLARCRQYQTHEPPEDWDGIHSLDSK